MLDHTKLYIDGRWVDPAEPGHWITVIDPSTEEEVARVAAGFGADLEPAVGCAQHDPLGVYRPAARRPSR
jgi:aldehyde dehydrogenase (NAD+)